MTLRNAAGGALLALLVALSSGLLVVAATDATVGVRVGGSILGFPISFGTAKIEGALAWGDRWSVTAWTEGYVPAWTADAGVGVRLSQDWLSVRWAAARTTGSTAISLLARAEPPHWLLYDGLPTVLAGMQADASVTWSPSRRFPEAAVSLTPSLTGILPVGPVTVSPSVSCDLSIPADATAATVSATRLSSTVDLGSVVLVHTVSFAGCAETFESLVMALNVPGLGVTVSGALHHVGASAFLYEIRVQYEWGDTSSLPPIAGEPGKICTGDVCY